MQCPKCRGQMETVEYEAVEIDRCTGCKGIWFDMLEHEDLKLRKGSEVMDVGDSETGAQFDQKDRIQCPKCNVAMLRLVDPAQPHIWYESCPVCHGAFFDAGEFRDLKDEGLFEAVKHVRKGPRQ